MSRLHELKQDNSPKFSSKPPKFVLSSKPAASFIAGQLDLPVIMALTALFLNAVGRQELRRQYNYKENGKSYINNDINLYYPPDY